MTSIRERILAQCLALAKPCAAGRAWRSRSDRIAPDEMPCINILPLAGKPRELSTIGTDERLLVACRVYARGDVPDTAADPVLTALHAALMSDPTLGGLAIDVSEGDDGTVFDFERTDQNSVEATAHYVIRYRHKRNSLTS